ncbi:DUF2182 domain-containing protein [Streptomyces sp. NPDC058249]|uniref:copper chaperone n=1 Tax=unclassified Streptomyces TaxID=2593676 RepID=UPI0036EA1A43
MARQPTAGRASASALRRLVSFGSFFALWVSMMAAMMLPGAAPATLRRARTGGGQGRAVPLFVGSYLAVWALAGVAVYAVYRPHGSLAAGAVVMAAAVYEVTPLKRHFRGRCRESVRSGWAFGLYCVGSSIGLMLTPPALGVMSVTVDVRDRRPRPRAEAAAREGPWMCRWRWQSSASGF